MSVRSKGRELTVYDGQNQVGTIKVADDGKARAFDVRGKRLGSFPSLTGAYAAFKPLGQPT
jgi:hypothetical protein